MHLHHQPLLFERPEIAPDRLLRNPEPLGEKGNPGRAARKAQFVQNLSFAVIGGTLGLGAALAHVEFRRPSCGFQRGLKENFHTKPQNVKSASLNVDNS